MTQDPLHGVTLKGLLTELIDHFGFEQLSQHIDINCFKKDASLNSSLKFLRKTPWARSKVEALYLQFKAQEAKNPWDATKGK